MAESPTNLVLGRGAAVDYEQFAVAMFDPDLDPSTNEEEPTLLFMWNKGAVSSHVVEWHVVAVVPMAAGEPYPVLLGRSGQVAIVDRSGLRTEIFDTSDDGPAGRGVMRNAARIGQQLWVVGMSRQVY